MLNTWPLCIGVESNLRDRVWGEVEKNSFIGLPGKERHSRLLLSEIMCSNLGGFGVFYSNHSRVIRLGCVQGLYYFNLVSDNLMSFCGSFNLA